MTVNNKRVFYVKYLAHEIYTEILKARPDVRLDRLENESPDAEMSPILSAAHAYQVGAARAELCKGLLHMKVIAYDPYLTAEEIAGRGGEKVELDDLMRRSDFVSISCPLSKDNRGMIGARQFALMQPHAFFITTARGFIHDEAALFEALRDKRIAGAGLDVWDKEPPAPEHPLLQFDNVLASPHTAGVTKEARVNMGKIAAEQILDALDGKRPPRVVNPEVWPDYVKRFERTFGFAPK